LTLQTDWNIPGGKATGESALARFEEILNIASTLNSGFIVLAHDIYQQTVDLSVGYVLPMAIASGRNRLMSIIDCLGLPASEAYIETSSNSTATRITSGSSGSTYYQPVIGTATGAAVTPSVSNSGGPSVTASSAGSASASGSVSGSASGSAGSGASRSAGSGAAAASQSGSGAAKMAGVNAGPILAMVGAIALGMMLLA
jgi:hypothetical protein